jgi:pre-mRNA-processing factor 19
MESFDAFPSEASKATKKLGSASALAESPETDSASARILYGAENGTAVVYETDGSAPPFELNTGSRILDGTFWESKAVFALASGAVKIYDGSNETASFAVHAGPATGVSLHPSGDLLASVGSDKSYVLYDLRSLDGQPAARVFSDSGKLRLLDEHNFNPITDDVVELTCCQFHPDGQLLAAGAKDGKIRIFNISTSEIGASLQTDGPVLSLSFSENGYFLASASAGSKTVQNWDLRKEAVANTIEFGQQVISVAWDHSAQFLAAVGSGAVAIFGYQKKAKTFEELLKKGVENARRVAWDPNGKHLLVDGPEGVLTLRQ